MRISVIKRIGEDGCTLPEALAIQDGWFDDIRGGTCAEASVLFAEHPPVYSLVRRNRPELLFKNAPPPFVPIHEFEAGERGGRITFHGPGQIVCYMVFKIEDFGFSIGSLTRTLDDLVIAALQPYGIKGETKPDNLPMPASGVWVSASGGNRKIASRGLRISEGITRFGFALNVSTDLSYYDAIYPCGLNIRMTSIKELTGKDVSLSEIADDLASGIHVFSKK
ncbi:lipoyl(octanoyl) transferase LipB [bacterium]|nr:lipoyl(octanoyl) transferase LipB [bacterium]